VKEPAATPAEVLGLRPAELPVSDLRDFRVGNGSESSCFLGDEAVIATRISTGTTIVVLQVNVNFRFPGLTARIVQALSQEEELELLPLEDEGGRG
jgi:hypothetical protein